MGLDMYLRVQDGNQTLEVGYWRKANATHNWFVTHCGDGVDECQPIPVEREDLTNLKTLCESVLEAPTTGPVNMPTVSGFFFGDTAYDDYYLSDIRHTVSICSKALDSDYKEFIYQASW